MEEKVWVFKRWTIFNKIRHLKNTTLVAGCIKNDDVMGKDFSLHVCGCSRGTPQKN